MALQAWRARNDATHRQAAGLQPWPGSALLLAKRYNGGRGTGTPRGTRTAYVGVVTRLSVRLIRPPFFNKAEVEG